MADLYAQDGVNVSEGDKFSAFAGNIVRASYGNSPFVSVKDFSRGHYRGPRTFELIKLPPGCTHDLTPDGIGTATIVMDAASAHRNASRNLLAMCNGDITRWGGLPLLFTNNLEVNTLGKEGDETNTNLRSLIVGLGTAAREQRIVLWKGETAEVGDCVGSENPDAVTKFNWSGTAFGVYHPDKMITGDRLEAGQILIALKDNFRSNGWSSVRKSFREQFGKRWYENPAAKEAMLAAIVPAKLYDLFLATINGWYGNKRIDVTLIVHVTGGAMKSKLASDILFRRGLSAELDDLWEPSAIMKECARWRGMDDEDCYETWNGGQGVLMAAFEQDADPVIRIADEYGIDAKRCGRIVRAQGRNYMKINSKFSGKEILFTQQSAS